MASKKPNHYRDVPEYKKIVQQYSNFCNSTIERALQSMVDRRLITYHKVRMIDFKEASYSDEEKIRMIELSLLQKHGKTDIHEIHKNPMLQYQFYNERNELLFNKYGK